jgi:hypothetical protein
VFDYTSGRTGVKNNAEQPRSVPEPQLACGKLPNGFPARAKRRILSGFPHPQEFCHGLQIFNKPCVKKEPRFHQET